MTLKNLFNFKYIFQNIKKNKSFLLLLFILFPAFFTSIIIWSLGHEKIISLSGMSFIMALFSFIPIIISYLLFGFVYKKKSIDFTLSLPLTRKEIFFSNTLLGMFIILILLILNVTILFLTSLFIPNIILYGHVLLDYIILWFTIYSFIFIVSNLSMSLSGNAISSIILTIITVIIIPFLIQYLSYNYYSDCYLKLDKEDANYIKNQIDANVIEHTNKKGYYLIESNITKNNISNIVYENTLSSIFTGFKENLYETKQMIFTTILSIIYIIIGYISFKYKKMEVSEIPFKSYRIQCLVKCIILSPLIILMSYNLFEGISIGVIILLLVIIGIYYLIDLITHMGIKNIKISIFYILVSFLILGGLTYIKNEYISEQDFFINIDDIDNISIKNKNYNVKNIKDKEIIKKIILDGFIQSPREYILDDDADCNLEYKIGNYTIKQKQFFTEKFKKELSKKFKEKQIDKRIKKYEYNYSSKLKLGSMVFSKNDIKDYKQFIDKENELKTLLSNDKPSYIINNAYIYYYDKKDHEIKEGNIKNPDLINYLINKSNKTIIQNLEFMKTEKDYQKINYMRINSNVDYINDEMFNENYYSLILDYLRNEKQNNVDINKEYVIFSIGYFNNNESVEENITLNIDEKLIDLLSIKGIMIE